MGKDKTIPDPNDIVDSSFTLPENNVSWDSDDPFEELEGNKNINFSRSRSYYDLNLYDNDFTPSKSKLDIEKENVKHNLKPNSSAVKKINRPNKNFEFERKAALSNLRGNKSEKFTVNPDNSAKDHSCSSICKSHHTPSNMIVSKTIFDNSRGSCSKYTPGTPLGLLANHNTPMNMMKTPKTSVKKYSIEKVALAAKKDFEDIMRLAKQHKLAKLNQAKRNSSSITPDNRNSKDITISSNNDEIQCSSSVHPNALNIIDDEDLPSTQPMSTIILRDVVAFVDVRYGRDDLSNGTKVELISLGAKVEKNFTRKVTHCVFQDGRMSTYRRAVEWKIPIISTLWIVACREELQMVPVNAYEPYGLDKYKEALPLYKLKTKIRRPMTDSKVPARVWKKKNDEKTINNVVDKKEQALSRPPAKKTSIIDALHSVAGDFKKATDQFQEILTSPVLQNTVEKSSKSKPPPGKKIRKSVSKKHNKKLIFPSSSEDEHNVGNNPTCNNNPINVTNDDIDNSVENIRVSYDSDDLLVYAKKQASSVRCSAPAKLLTGKRFKKLLHSGQKSCDQNKESSRTDDVLRKDNEINSKDKETENTKELEGKGFIIPGSSKMHGNKDKCRKRKLILPNQVMSTFRQDSEESASDMSPSCPYKESPNKRIKSANKSKATKPLFKSIFSDYDSDDSLTRAARRESSALFVKKEKKIIQKRTPTLVCTSVPCRDTQVVSDIVSKLGRFTVEPSVSENTTHVVTVSPRRTINLLKAIARGCWVLHVKWVYESLEAGQWLHEERFEFLEFSMSVQTARIERHAFGPEFSLELFKGLGLIYVCRTTKAPASDLTELIRLCGGTVVSNARAASIIVGPATPFSPIGRRPPLVVSQNWVLDSITRLSQLDPRDYVLND